MPAPNVRAVNRPTVWLVGTALVLSGCASQASRIGADDNSDPCHAYLARFDDTGDHWQRQTATGAVIGAVGGAALGAILSGGKTSGIVAGAAAGGVAGAAAGYAQSQSDQQKAKSEVYAQISSDYDQRLGQIDASLLAFKQLVDCRNASLRQVADQYKAHAISRDQASAQWKAILARKQHDLEIAAADGKNMQSYMGDFEQNANNKLNDYQTVPWDAATQADLQKQQVALNTSQAQETSALKRDYDGQATTIKHQQKSAADKAQAKAALDAKYQADQQRLKQKQQADQTALQQKKAGQVPTSTAQTHIQSYNETVAQQQSSYQTQLATANNPDGFEASLADQGGGKGVTLLDRPGERLPS